MSWSSCKLEDRGKPGNRFNGHGGRLRVLLDGVEVSNRCYYANEEDGRVDCYKHNAEGKPYIDPENPGDVARETLRGEVRIEDVT